MINGSFLNGDRAGWTSVNTGLTVIPRGTGGSASAVDTAPTPFVLRAPDDGTQQQGHAAQAIPCRPGERFLIEAEVAGAGGGGGLNFSWQLFLQFYDAAGGIVATQSRTIAVTSTAWQRPALNPITTPAGAVTCNLIVRRVGGGAGFSYLTNLSLDVERGFSALNAASITAEAVARAGEDGAMATQINTVSATVNSKNKTFRQGTAPANNTANDLRAGDLWYDTGNGNRPYRWSGSAWQLTDDARIAQTAATVTTHATAIGNIQTGLQAGYLMRAQAGNAVSLIDMVAADGGGGVPSSIIKLMADDILFRGSVGMEMLTFLDLTGNMVPDAEMVSPGAWSIAGDWFMFTEAQFNWSRGESAGEVQWRGAAGFRQKDGIPFSVFQGIEYRLDGKLRHFASTGTSGVINGRIAIVWLDVNGAEISTSGFVSINKNTAAAGNNYAEGGANLTAPTGARKAKIRLNLWSDNEVHVGFNSISCIRKRTGNTLITPGGVTSDLVTADTVRALLGQFVSLEAANLTVGNGEIDTLQIRDGAVATYWAANADRVTITVSYRTKLLIQTNVRVSGSAGGWAINYELRVGGSPVDTTVFSVSPYTWSFPWFKAVTVDPGTYTIRHIYTGDGGNSFSNYRTSVFGIYV